MEGGHSGDIYWKRANAIKLLARVLFECEHLNIRIVSLSGGTRRNVIPSSAHADLVVPDNEIEKLTQIVKKTEEISREEFYDSDPNIKIELLEIDFENNSVIEKNTGVSIVRFLMAIHQGLASINPDMLRLPHQSCNLALIEDHGDYLKIPAFSRGNTHYAIQTMVSRVVAVGELVGAEIIHENSYPAWQMQKDSRLAELVNETHIELFDSPIDFVAGHGGLEAGVICDKYPDLDAICLCALIKEGHSTNERMCVKSVKKLYQLLKKLVSNIAVKY